MNFIMTNETTNETTNEEAEGTQGEMTPEKWNELLQAVHHNGLVALRMSFKEVEGQISQIDAYGAVFIYRVKNAADEVYFCGFFLRELIGRFQSGNDPAMWMASFFHELMKTPGGKALPKPPANEEEAKAVIDNVLVPQCIEAIQEEFAPEQIHAGLAFNEEHGPVLEAGFPSIVEGPNVCAVPLHFLLTHLQLNRDPSELLITGMYNIRKENGLD